MSTTDHAQVRRRYRFGPRDRTGWFLGLGGVQCGVLGVGIVLAGILVNLGTPFPIVIVPIGAACGFAFGRWKYQPVHEWLPVAGSWFLARRRGDTAWFAPLPTTTLAKSGRQRSASRATATPLVFPPSLDGLRVMEVSAGAGRDTAGVAVVFDHLDRTASVVIRASSSQFSLCEPGEQERLVGQWGDVLAGFCVEGGPVGRFRWTEWAAPSDLTEQLAYLNERAAPDGDRDAFDAYQTMVEHAGPFSAQHEVLLTVTVEERRLRRRTRTNVEAALVDTVLEQATLLARRLEAAGLGTGGLLSVGEFGRVIRSRVDPYGLPRPASGSASLAELVGFVAPENAGPMVMQAEWDHVRVDGAFHAAYVVSEWPRLEVPANWMEPLLFHAGGIRTIAVHYEPVAPSRSQRRVDRESVKLASDEEQRSRAGFRIGARHRRAHDEVLDREDELVAGYAEFEFVGFVIVTAATLDELRASCAEYEQVGGQTGLELRRLDGRHDLALACALPIGRGIAARRFA